MQNRFDKIVFLFQLELFFFSQTKHLPANCKLRYSGWPLVIWSHSTTFNLVLP
uniref:Uncharacterized protein n=1 Tax=Anguilla anguilla TaxID=7936 RepID=A0A0E9UHB0_ANGAN